ncbi:TPA: efflux RND transporter periplasmic adaptor subunit, partial [Legionella pneumophila]|nr:efflux RND transporter periplasmic adaptor subunit [Legionella pneumophila]
DVTLGVRAGDLLEIIKGVKEGDQIITSANFLIDSESQLKAAMGGMQHQ